MKVAWVYFCFSSQLSQLNFANFPESLNKWFRWIFSEYVRCLIPSFVGYLIMRNLLLRITILIGIHYSYMNVNLRGRGYYSLLYKVCFNELLLGFINTSSKLPYCCSVCHNAFQVFPFFDCLRAMRPGIYWTTSSSSMEDLWSWKSLIEESELFEFLQQDFDFWILFECR